MQNCSSIEDGQRLLQALHHLRFAIGVLDEAQAPAQIAARVDLAAHELTVFIERLGRATMSAP